MARRLTDTNITVTLDRDERRDLVLLALRRGVTVAELFRVAMNRYLAGEREDVAALKLRRRGRPRKT